MASDDFELVLERCRDRLAEINLRVQDLEASSPRSPAPLTLEPDDPPRARLPPLAEIPIAPPAPEAPPRPELPAVAADSGETYIFPPPGSRPWTPLPASRPMTAGEGAPEARPARLRHAALAAAAAVAAGGLGVWLERRPSNLSFGIDAIDALAVRPDKGDILAARGKELVDMAMDGRTLRRLPLEAPVRSLRWNQGSLWSVDGRTAAIVEHPDGDRETVFPLNHVPETFFVKDKYLWTAEKGAHAIHQFLISRSILGAILQPLDLYDLPGLTPETFALDDAGDLWIVDSASRRLYRLRSEGGTFKPVASAPLSPLVGPEGRIRALTIEGGSVWLLSAPAQGARGVLSRIVLSRLDWTPS